MNFYTNWKLLNYGIMTVVESISAGISLFSIYKMEQTLAKLRVSNPHVKRNSKVLYFHVSALSISALSNLAVFALFTTLRVMTCSFPVTPDAYFHYFSKSLSIAELIIIVSGLVL